MAEVTIQQAFERVVQHRKAGRAAEADALYQHIVKQIPREPNALHTLGVLAQQAGQNEFAADLFRRAIELSPDDAEFHDHLGLALAAMGRWQEAAPSFRRAMDLAPSAETCLNLAHALRRTGDATEAAARYRQAIELQPNFHSAHNNLGNLLRENGQLDDAISSFQRAIELKPDYLEAFNNLGSALLESGKPDQAIANYQHALSLRADLPELHNNLGKAFRAKGDVPGSIAAHERVLSMRPDDADAHWNRSLMLLLSGQLEQGWDEYEWRWRVPEFKSPRRNFSQPLWSGQPLRGRRILLHAEQGFGDTIQFCRYAPLVASLGGRVILEAPPELHPLLHTLPGIEQFVIAGQSLPDFDLHCPLLSLPRAFRTTLQTIPDAIPHLRPAADQITRWKARLEFPKDRLRIGLAWAGSAANPNDRNRSLSLETLAPLADASDVAFYNLQTGPAAEAGRRGRRPFSFANDPLAFDDFADTAGLVANLDLILTVDTALAHLAGAMAAPVWLLLPFAPDWRWLLDREDTPWYPTMRLLRQPRLGDWGSIIRHARSELENVLARLTKSPDSFIETAHGKSVPPAI
jgi:tetratricopeptide (TPR) repeat protein